MLPSMPFLSTNSDASASFPLESVISSELNVQTILNEKESSDNLKENAVSKKLPEEKIRITSKPNSSINSTRQKPPSKAQRELEANKAMFLNNDPTTDEIKDTTYAAAFFEKVKSRLSCNKINSNTISKFETFQTLLNNFDPQIETPCELYNTLKDFFGTENVDLAEEFLTFLTPGQATDVGRFMDYFMLTCMSDFIERLQIFFSNKPAQLRKILWCLENLAEKPENEITMDSVKIAILPLLKGNQYLIDWFLKLFPEEKPPECLINNGYEVIDLENMNDSEEPSCIGSGYEVLNIPNTSENYGNDLCTCTCHNLTNAKFKNRLRHCLACGTKYIQGRMYAQHGRALRSVFLNWHNGDVDQTRRLSSSLSPRQGNSRKRTASIDPQNSVLLLKPDSDDERVSPKRNSKFMKTPTSKGKKSANISKNLSKSNENNDCNQNPNKTCSKNILKDDERLELPGNRKNIDSHCSDVLAVSLEHSSENLNDDIEIIDDSVKCEKNLNINEAIEDATPSNIQENCDNDLKRSNENLDSSGSRTSINFEVSDIQCDGNVLLKCKESIPVKTENTINWTREEDKIILLILREETNPKFTLNKIRDLIPHRTLDEIRQRFENVLNLLQKL